MIPGLKITNITGPILAVVTLALINSTIWSTALFLNVPDHFSIEIFTLLFSNAILFWLVVKLLPGIEIEGILPAFIAPVLYSILSIVVSRYAPMVPWAEIAHRILGFIGALKEDLSKTQQKTSLLLTKLYELC